MLFSRPDALAKAAAAAKADDDDALSDLVFEALRFRPINPMVVRVAKEDYRLAAGEPHRDADPQGHDRLRADLVGHVRPARAGGAGGVPARIGPTTITCTSPPGCMPASADTSAGSRSRRSSSRC